MRRTQPLFRLDAGWLFIIAGLALCASVVLLPAQRDLHALQQQREHLLHQERMGRERLRAHVDFLNDVDSGDEAVIRRLIARQLNLVPEGDTPVLMTAQSSAAMLDWIDARAGTEPPPVQPWPESRLSRMASGPERLWLFGGGVMAVFLGLLIGQGRIAPH